MNASSDERHAELRRLPAIDDVVASLTGSEAHPLKVAAARTAVATARARVIAGAEAPDLSSIVDDARAQLDRGYRSLLRAVVNATGVLIHTNLGRAPLGDEQIDAVRAVSTWYSNLEYDVESGSRGSRYTHASTLITAVTGAEAALVVNNNAAAVLVVLAALCDGKEVVISRGELIEIGGEFRIPDVIGSSGARLVEVGTTNRTHLADYERAITPNTAALLKVHPSNYRVVGFTSTVSARDLARLAHGRRIYLIHDIGSGLLAEPHDASWIGSEPLVENALADGADIVTFSGDKLLGGPQAGIIVGRADMIERIAKHPLMRAVRVDKMTLAALEATLRAYLEGRMNDVPLWKLATASLDGLEARARAIVATIGSGPGWKVEAVPSVAVPGGGSAPGSTLSSWAVAIVHPERSPDGIGRSLRQGEPAVIARIEDDVVIVDLRSVLADQDAAVAAAIRRALADR